MSATVRAAVASSSLILFLVLATATLAGDLFVVAGGGGAKYKNVVTVAKSGAPYTSIQAALDSITDASTDNRYLVFLAPGTYEERVQLKDWVDVRGASRQSTVITYQGGAGDSSSCTVYANNASNSELSNLTVCNTGGSYASAIGIYCNQAAPRLNHLDVYVDSNGAGDTYGIRITNNNRHEISDIGISVTSATSGDCIYGLDIYNSSKFTIKNTNLELTTTSGSTEVCGIRVSNCPSALMRGAKLRLNGHADNANVAGIFITSSAIDIRDTTVKLNGGGAIAAGIMNNLTSPLSMTNVSVTVDDPAGEELYGLYNAYCSDVLMQNMTIKSSGTPSNKNIGVYSLQTPARFSGLTVEVSGSGNKNRGVDNEESSPELAQCSITVDDAAGDAVGVLNRQYSRPRLVSCNVQGGHVGLYNKNADSGGNPIIVSNSSLEGTTASLVNEVNYTTYLTNCLLDGVVDIQGGTVVCGGCYDAIARAVTCP